jgi:tRNA dimethylallyltransferase
MSSQFDKPSFARCRLAKEGALVVIVGETASGKSALALELAGRFDGELICADSWTVYKGFDIGTAKPTAEERARVPHHLLDVADPAEGFSVVVFQKLAKQAIADITARGRLPIMVGGTGLYIDSVLYDYGFLPKSDPELRSELNVMSLENVLERAAELGLDTTGIDMRNKRRMIRLIENNGVRPTKHELRPNTLVLGVGVSRDELRDRATARVDAMMTNGLEVEVRELAERYGWDAEPMKGIGYREWRTYFQARHISGESVRSGAHVPKRTLRSGAPLSSQAALESENPAGEPVELSDVRERIIKATMDLAKRQRTWFKRNSSIQWAADRSSIAVILTTFLNKTDSR